jgi:sec-independent protein translocase protein TatB
MVRQSELEELEKKWKAENERIMREHPADPRAEVIGDDNPPAQPELPMGAAPAAEAPTKP